MLQSFGFILKFIFCSISGQSIVLLSNSYKHFNLIYVNRCSVVCILKKKRIGDVYMIIFLSHLHFLHDLDNQEIRKSIKLLQDIYTNAVEFNDILNEF